MNKPHVHAELIKAWADGAEIEYRHRLGWIPATTPTWGIDETYRIKPKPDVVTYVAASVFQAIAYCTTKQLIGDNLKLTFDGETLALKSAEVLK